MAGNYMEGEAALYEKFHTTAGEEFYAPAPKQRALQAEVVRDDQEAALGALYGPSVQLANVEDPRIAGEVGGHQHPVLQLKNRMYPSGLEHEVQMMVMHAIRQYVPTLDAAIGNRRALEGEVYVTSEDEGLADALNEFTRQVPVGYLAGNASQRGLNTYLNMMADNADEYGLSAGEIVADEQGTEVKRLVVPNARTLALDDQDDGTYGLVQKQDGQKERLDDKPLVQTLSFSYNTEEPWPRPMAWSLVKSSEIIMRMFEAVINGWWRFGDPSILNAIEYSDPEQSPETERVGSGASAQEIPKALWLFKDSMEQVMKARRRGQVGDVYAYTDAGGEIKSEVIGDIDSTLMKFVNDHRSSFAGDIIAHSKTPAWMYPSFEMGGDGLGSARSNNQAMMCATDARKRSAAKEALARDVIDTYLLLTGDGRYIGSYDIEFEEFSIIDDKLIAEARKEEAAADSQVIENVELAFTEDGSRRYSGEAERILEESGIYRD